MRRPPAGTGHTLRADATRGLAGVLALAGGAASLHQLLYGWHWFALMMLAATLVAALGVAGRAARIPAGLLVAVQLVGVATLTTTLFARDTAIVRILPGRAALGQLVDTVRTGTDAINHYSPPAPAVAGIALLLVLGAGVGATVIDILVSQGLPALTGVVVLAFQAVTALCLPTGVSAVSFLLGGAGWLALLLVAGPPGRPAGHDPEASGGQVGAGSGPAAGRGAVGRRTALTSLGLAAFVPALLPGLSSSRLTQIFSGGAGGSGGSGGSLLTVRDPLVELRRNLVQPANVVVLRYGTATTPGEYLRLATLDQFDGQAWTAPARQVRRRTDTGITAPEGLQPAVPRTANKIAFTVADGLSSSYLPVPYPVTQLAADGGWWFDPSGLDVMSYSWRATGGFAYVTRSLDLSFDPVQLRRAPAAPAAVRARDLGLPDLPPVVARTARRVTAAARNDFDRAVALQSWFRGAFTYDTSIVDASSTGALVRFLSSKRGYCEQFSATMAVMARILGIPSRVVVGFLPGTQPDADGWVVTAHEAHAWPELYFGGAGWVRFEPTPAVQSGAEPDWTVDTSTLDGSNQLPQPVPRTPPRTGPTPARSSAPPAGAGGGGPSGGSGLPVRPSVAAGIVGAVAAAAVVPAATAKVLRERRWRSARPGAAGGAGRRHPSARQPGGARIAPPANDAGSVEARATAAAVQADLADMAWDHAGGWSAATTPRQLGQRLGRELRDRPAAADAAQRLVRLVEQVRYAPGDAPIRLLDPDGIRADSELVRRSLAERSPRWRRSLFVLVPAALRRRLGAAFGSGPTPPPGRTPDAAVTAPVLARRDLR